MIIKYMKIWAQKMETVKQKYSFFALCARVDSLWLTWSSSAKAIFQSMLFLPSWKTFAQVFSTCIRWELLTEIWNLKIFYWTTINSRLLILDHRSYRKTFLFGVNFKQWISNPNKDWFLNYSKVLKRILHWCTDLLKC